MAEQPYKAFPIIFKSHGLIARSAVDRCPSDTYLNLSGCLEREENAISIRYGSVIINRSATATGSPPVGHNYYFNYSPVVLARLLTLDGTPYRYAILSDGSLNVRQGDAQGQYTQIEAASYFSGKPFSWLVATLYQSAKPYLFLCDSKKQVKVDAMNTPTNIGILPPAIPAQAAVLGPTVSSLYDWDQILTFVSGGSTGALTSPAIVSTEQAALANAAFYSGTVPSSSASLLPDNVRGYNGAAVRGEKFGTYSYVGTAVAFEWHEDTNTYLSSDTLTFPTQAYTVSAASPAYVTGNDGVKTVDWSVFGDTSLVVLVASLVGSSTTPVTSFELRLIYNHSGGTYFSTTIQIASSTTEGGVNVFRIPKSSFRAVGVDKVAGWAAITGFQLVFTCPTGGASLSFNSIYMQGPTTSGYPSSQGGVGYDYMYRFVNANTGTPSNPGQMMRFARTGNNPTGASLLYPFQQPVLVQGGWSSDPQTTHVEIYRRGGLYPSDWFYLTRIANTGVGAGWSFTDIFSDSTLQTSLGLQAGGGLANDVPVTSTLQNPINTTLSAAITPSTVPLALTASTVTTVSGTFVANQIVNIGNPNNIEQVVVITGGTGTFTAYVQMAHAIGEQVTAYSIPAQPCTMTTVAYNQRWIAGDPNNPHYLYYCVANFPENCSPQNYIPVGTPNDPIKTIVNFRGTLYVSTMSQWWQIWPGVSGNPPYPQPVGSAHGCVANQGWVQTEGELWNASADGIRAFNGGTNNYKSLPIEWLWQSNPQTPVPLVDLSQIANIWMAYQNHTVTICYLSSTDGLWHRLLYDTAYQRWRCDDVQSPCMCLEVDTNTLVYAKAIGNAGNWAVCYDSYTQDYDDGGWSAGTLVHDAIPFTMQTPYFDQGAPNNPKQYNTLTLDADPNGQALYVKLLCDDNQGNIVEVIPNPTAAFGAGRQKFEFAINSGKGQQAYRASLKVYGYAKEAPVIYQADLYSMVLADNRVTFDTYWLNFSTDESKLVKQGFFDYTASHPITVDVFADGEDAPYYTFTLAANPTRQQVPERARFTPKLCRLFRLVATSSSAFQFWRTVRVDWKPVKAQGGFHIADLEGSL